MTSTAPSLGLDLPSDEPATTHRAATDAEAGLVERARTDPAAFSEIYRLHYAALGAYLFRRSGDEHATEDMLAETFLSALQSLSRFEARGIPVRFWLYRIATNVANRRWREIARRVEGTAQELETDAHADHASPSDALERDEAHARAQRALLALQPDLQAVLSLFYFQELSIDDIARVLECPSGTVKSRLSRARDAFTLALQRRSTP